MTIGDQWYLDLLRRQEASQRPPKSFSDLEDESNCFFRPEDIQNAIDKEGRVKPGHVMLGSWPNVVQMEIPINDEDMERIMSIYEDRTSNAPETRLHKPLESVQSGPVYTVPTYPTTKPAGKDPIPQEGKTAAIIGVGGQDGSYLSELLISLGYKVLGICRRNTRALPANVEKLMDAPDDFQYVIGDVTDQCFITNFIASRKPDLIFNLSAQSHVGTSFELPHQTFDVTAAAVLNVLEAVRLFSPASRVYQASSSEMFGCQYSCGPVAGVATDGTLLYKDKYGYFQSYSAAKFQDEKTPMIPRSPYGVAKLAAHNMIRMYREAYGIFAVGGILFNHESERRGEVFVTRKVTKYLGRLKKHIASLGNRNVVLNDEDGYYGDGFIADISKERLATNGCRLKLGNLKASRDWGHAEDYVRAMVLMMQAPTPKDYVVGTGETHTIEEFVKKAFEYSNLGYWNNFVDIDESLKRPAEVDYLKADASLIEKELGWKPRVSFDELVRRMVAHDCS